MSARSTKRPVRLIIHTLTAAVLLGGTPLAAAQATGSSHRRLDEVSARLKGAEDTLKLVETQYTQRPEPSSVEALSRRYSEGEIQYLLGNYPGASVLFYDLVSDPEFQIDARYGDALYYLADTLYQQKNYIGARLYLRQLLAMHTGHYRNALTRYIEIAGRLNDFGGIDVYLEKARGPSGELPPELTYVYGKWMFKRPDLSRADRTARAREVFSSIAGTQGTYALQATYFLGVLAVQDGKLDEAVTHFRTVVTAPGQGGAREAKVRELSNLSLGRVLYEQGKYDEALDRYQEIPQDSDAFVDALFEIAWARVKKGEIEQARNATDILLLLAPESTIAPEAQILQGHLQLKLKRYQDATDTYGLVINTYAPVRDELDALLTVHKDPVAYFDELLAKNERNLDVTSLLPPVAAKWATTQQEVTDAVRLVDDLEGGRRGVGEGRQIAQRILTALDTRGMESFPALQEGYTRADAVDSALTEVNEQLVRLEAGLLASVLTPQERAELDTLTRAQAELQKRFDALPTTPDEVEARRDRLQARVDQLDGQAFRLGYEVQSMSAVLNSVRKWVHDTRAERQDSKEEEEAFLWQVENELSAVSELERELGELRAKLRDERGAVGSALSGEESIRRRFAENLEKQHALLARAEGRAPAQVTPSLERAHQIRDRALGLLDRVLAAKQVLREQVARRGQVIRNKVVAEQAMLEDYEREAKTVSGEARGLVGRIAFDSFRRVRHQFYELVLKADVGIVDVSFTRKQDKTARIQDLSTQKDRELRALDEEFQEVLEDVE